MDNFLFLLYQSIAHSHAGFWRRLACGFCIAMFVACSASAHAPSSAIVLNIERKTVDVEIRLPLVELGQAIGSNLADDPAKSVWSQYGTILRYIMGRMSIADTHGNEFTCLLDESHLAETAKFKGASNNWLVLTGRCEAPHGSSTEHIVLTYTAIMDKVVPHSTVVYVRHDLQYSIQHLNPQVVGVLTNAVTTIRLDGEGNGWWNDFSYLFTMGMDHIATGPDHLLFLLTLLLPAPLLAQLGHWGKPKPIGKSVKAIIGVVTGFTVGHSVSLALAVTGVIHPPARLVEIFIALSILISAVHAWRPFMHGREIWVATGFGLVHGLAFAETLVGLNVEPKSLILILGGFNSGIEVMQIFVIMLLLPTLLIASRRRYYAWIRLSGVVFATFAAMGWLFERAFGAKNPLAPLVNLLSPPSALVIDGLGLISIYCLCLLLLHARTQKADLARPR